MFFDLVIYYETIAPTRGPNTQIEAYYPWLLFTYIDHWWQGRGHGGRGHGHPTFAKDWL